jgi:antitoxin component YwqK of YwqJK toxin-antitoxin module
MNAIFLILLLNFNQINYTSKLSGGKNSIVNLYQASTRYKESETVEKNGIEIVISTGKTVTGIVYKNFENGRTYIESSFVDGIKNGPFRTWHENGNKEMEIYYKNGKVNGPLTKWFQNGNLQLQTYLKNGLQDGINKEWFESGQLKIESVFKNDKPDGYFKTWYENGQIRTQGTEKNNQQTFTNCWYEDGKPKTCK